MRIFRRKKAPPPLTCQELVELVTDFLEDMLPPEERRRFVMHLDGCPSCPTHLDQMRMTLEAMGRLTAGDLEPDAEMELLEAFRDWRTAKGQ